MGTTMTLIKIVQELNALDKESTIYAAKPWTENSQALALPEPESGGMPQKAKELGLSYFIEVFIAQDFLIDWMANLDIEKTNKQKCRRLIQLPKILPKNSARVVTRTSRRKSALSA